MNNISFTTSIGIDGQWQGYDVLNQSACFFNFQDIGNETDQVILGNSFLSNFVTVFDVEGSQVGLGISQFFNDTATQGPWISDYKPATIVIGIFAYTMLITVGVIVIGVFVLIVLKLRKPKEQGYSQMR